MAISLDTTTASLISRMRPPAIRDQLTALPPRMRETYGSAFLHLFDLRKAFQEEVAKIDATLQGLADIIGGPEPVVIPIRVSREVRR